MTEIAVHLLKVLSTQILLKQGAEKGSIEVGKFADFVILNQNIMEIDGAKIPATKVISTFLNGERVY